MFIEIEETIYSVSYTDGQKRQYCYKRYINIHKIVSILDSTSENYKTILTLSTGEKLLTKSSSREILDLIDSLHVD